MIVVTPEQAALAKKVCFKCQGMGHIARDCGNKVTVSKKEHRMLLAYLDQEEKEKESTCLLNTEEEFDFEEFEGQEKITPEPEHHHIERFEKQEKEKKISYFKERKSFFNGEGSNINSNNSNNEGKMIVVTPEQAALAKKVCFKCQGMGHIARDCGNKVTVSKKEHRMLLAYLDQEEKEKESTCLLNTEEEFDFEEFEGQEKITPEPEHHHIERFEKQEKEKKISYFKERKSFFNGEGSNINSNNSNNEGKMIVVTPEQAALAKKVCFKCQGMGHIARDCGNKVTVSKKEHRMLLAYLDQEEKEKESTCLLNTEEEFDFEEFEGQEKITPEPEHHHI
uniref:CCHC-type domain-containing protein n=1 Tax=Chenopodium quinoa TaxID=63459 RepID=A0A803L1H9_CHEQI